MILTSESTDFHASICQSIAASNFPRHRLYTIYTHVSKMHFIMLED